MAVTAFYAALLALLYLALSANVSRLRLKHRISLGVGDLPKLERAMRAHGNFVEYVPFILILMGLLESLGGPVIALHLMGSLLLIARFSHAYCLCIKYIAIMRQAGALITYTLLFVGAVMVLIQYF
tara:strand:+ start:2119 stop:2496 length:378 start_codon:yes stop_codon:yes gene_type:complete